MRPVFIRYLVPSSLLAACLVSVPWASGQTYSAGFGSAEWTTKSGAFNCTLSHAIPGFGQAQFSRGTGVSEYLELRQSGNAKLADTVRIESVPPVWRNDLGASLLGELQLSGAQSIRIAADQLNVIRSTLERGSSVALSRSQPNANGEAPRVILEARNFNAAYGRYKTCVNGLIPYTFNQISRMLFNYAPDAKQLSDATRRQLDKIVRYTKADPSVLGVLVDAHSDALATPDESYAASRRQAELVTAYLVDKGLSAKKIRTRWHGDQFPIANNQHKSGQAKNRRVTVRMENAATRKQMEKKIAALLAAEQQAAAKKAAEAKAAEETAAVQQIAQENVSIAPAALPVSLQQLEQLVEQQDITHGWQPASR